MINIDKLIIQFDNVLKTILVERPHRKEVVIPETTLNEDEKKISTRLMRVNHTGEVCAQALYQGQGLTARKENLQKMMQQAAKEETMHLQWTAARIHELGGRTSYLNPLWYGASLGIGALSGILGDKWNLGFLVETEKQVVQHLEDHLHKLPERDAKSKAIVEKMKNDELQHALAAYQHGARELPGLVKVMMRFTARIMTRTSYWV